MRFSQYLHSFHIHKSHKFFDIIVLVEDAQCTYAAFFCVFVSVFSGLNQKSHRVLCLVLCVTFVFEFINIHYPHNNNVINISQMDINKCSMRLIFRFLHSAYGNNAGKIIQILPISFESGKKFEKKTTCKPN